MEPNNNRPPPSSPAIPQRDGQFDQKSSRVNNDPDDAFSLCDAYMFYSRSRQAATHNNTGASNSVASNAGSCLIGIPNLTIGENDCKPSSNNNNDSTNKAKKKETTARDEDEMPTPTHRKSNRKPNNIRISSHDVAAQLLARMDKQSYQEAIEKDAKTINENYLLPFSFPWRQGAKLPEKARDSFPRDIDDLHVTTHCDGELTTPRGDSNEPQTSSKRMGKISTRSITQGHPDKKRKVVSQSLAKDTTVNLTSRSSSERHPIKKPNVATHSSPKTTLIRHNQRKEGAKIVCSCKNSKCLK